MSRAQKKGEEVSEPRMSSGVQAVVNSDAELKVAFDNLRTQVEGIDSKLKLIGDKITLMDLKSVEDKMAGTLGMLNMANSTLTGIEKELRTLITYAFVFNFVGVAGVIIVLLYALRAGHVI